MYSVQYYILILKLLFYMIIIEKYCYTILLVLSPFYPLLFSNVRTKHTQKQTNTEFS